MRTYLEIKAQQSLAMYDRKWFTLVWIATIRTLRSEFRIYFFLDFSLAIHFITSTAFKLLN